MSSKLIVPVALGLSLVTVTALVVYYVFKKDEEEEEGKTVKTARVNHIEVSVPKSIVPALIGRSGSNIKEIEKKSGAMIHFKKFSDKDYDVCIIRGRSQATQLAETLVLEFIKQQPVIVDDSITVPSWACGRIIGSGGENINEISHRSGARIKVEGLALMDSTERSVSLKGTKEQIEQAKKLIENCVAQEKCRREIEQSKRSPRHGGPLSPTTLPCDVTTASRDVTTPADVTTTPGDSAKRTKYRRPETVGACIEVYVSAVSSPSRFWVQLVGPQVAQLDELVDQMTEYYSRKENRDNHKLTSVSVGQVVAAVFRHDGRWYRARVHDIRPNEFDATKQVADVFYVDYGDSEYVATHELCELRADLLRLRFQAMECFLAGVSPANSEPTPGQRWDHWPTPAVERFEELTKVAQWKPLVSRTCTYKKTASGDGDKEKEIPGIKLFEVTPEGELDIGATLISEGWALPAAPTPAPPAPPAAPPVAPQTPFGDLGASRVLGIMLSGENARASSLPKDHKDDSNDGEKDSLFPDKTGKENDRMTSSKSLASGLEHSEQPKAVSNFDITYPNATGNTKAQLNGSHDLITSERKHTEEKGSSENVASAIPPELKANMNRIDSHHGSLEALGSDLHKF